MLGDLGVRVLAWDAPGFDHHRFGDRYLLFPRFWGCTRPVSVVVKHGHGRTRVGVSPLVDVGVRVLVWDTTGFSHHRFGGRCLFYSRFWGCTRPVSVFPGFGVVPIRCRWFRPGIRHLCLLVYSKLYIYKHGL